MRKQNIRQKELGLRRREMFWLACENQRRELTSIDPKEWKGMCIETFLKEYSLRYDTGEYTTRGYFELFRDTNLFETMNQKYFKVNEKVYQDWLKIQGYLYKRYIQEVTAPPAKQAPQQ